MYSFVRVLCYTAFNILPYTKHNMHNLTLKPGAELTGTFESEDAIPFRGMCLRARLNSCSSR